MTFQEVFQPISGQHFLFIPIKTSENQRYKHKHTRTESLLCLTNLLLSSVTLFVLRLRITFNLHFPFQDVFPSNHIHLTVTKLYKQKTIIKSNQSRSNTWRCSICFLFFSHFKLSLHCVVKLYHVKLLISRKRALYFESSVTV